MGKPPDADLRSRLTLRRTVAIVAALAACGTAMAIHAEPPAAAPPGMVVIVHYTGWLYDPSAQDLRGRQFDSSRERGQPFSFHLGSGHVIRGWEQGIPGMKVGGTRRLVIPPELAYGSKGAGNGVIPPDATLLFEVELLAVETVTLHEQQ